MSSAGDELGIIKIIDQSTLGSASIGIVPEVWPALIKLLKMLKLPSPEILFKRSIELLGQYRGSLDDDKIPQNSNAQTFAAKIIQLERGGKVSPWDAQSACVSNIIAGSDTTAITLNAALYHIYTIPEVLGKLRDEIGKGSQDGSISDPVTFDESQKMPYLQAIISEALRIHPAVGVSLARVVPAGGVTIHNQFFPPDVSDPSLFDTTHDTNLVCRRSSGSMLGG